MGNEWANELRSTILHIAFLMVGFGLLVFLIKIFFASLLRGKSRFKPQSYEAIPFLLTEAEKRFHEALYEAVGQQFLIYPKVGLSDIVDVRKNLSKSDWQSAWNQISQKHVDFILCSPGDYRVLAVIELDDSSHQAKSLQDRDSMIDEILKSINLPILHIKAARTYDSQQLAVSVATVLS